MPLLRFKETPKQTPIKDAIKAIKEILVSPMKGRSEGVKAKFGGEQNDLDMSDDELFEKGLMRLPGYNDKEGWAKHQDKKWQRKLVKEALINASEDEDE